MFDQLQNEFNPSNNLGWVKLQSVSTPRNLNYFQVIKKNYFCFEFWIVEMTPTKIKNRISTFFVDQRLDWKMIWLLFFVSILFFNAKLIFRFCSDCHFSCFIFDCLFLIWFYCHINFRLLLFDPSERRGKNNNWTMEKNISV